MLHLNYCSKSIYLLIIVLQITFSRIIHSGLSTEVYRVDTLPMNNSSTVYEVDSHKTQIGIPIPKNIEFDYFHFHLIYIHFSAFFSAFSRFYSFETICFSATRPEPNWQTSLEPCNLKYTLDLWECYCIYDFRIFATWFKGVFRENKNLLAK